MITPEHDLEPMPGLPAMLPDDEYLVWQGRPKWQALSRDALQTRAIAVYFAAIVGWRLVTGFYDGDPFWTVILSAGIFSGIGAAALGLFDLFAWLVQRTTLYTITNKRVVMRIGVALSMTLNLPFRVIASADVRAARDGTGTIALKLSAVSPFSWLVLWPHARPFHLARPQPALRSVPNVAEVAERLSAALRADLEHRQSQTAGKGEAGALAAAASKGRPVAALPIAARAGAVGGTRSHETDVAGPFGVAAG